MMRTQSPTRPFLTLGSKPVKQEVVVVGRVSQIWKKGMMGGSNRASQRHTVNVQKDTSHHGFSSENHHTVESPPSPHHWCIESKGGVVR